MRATCRMRWCPLPACLVASSILLLTLPVALCARLDEEPTTTTTAEATSNATEAKSAAPDAGLTTAAAGDPNGTVTEAPAEEMVTDAPAELAAANISESNDAPGEADAAKAGVLALKELTAENVNKVLKAQVSALDPLTGPKEVGCGERITIETSNGCSIGKPMCPPGWTDEGTRFECCKKVGWNCVMWTYFRRCTRCENEIKGTALFYKRGQLSRSLGVGFLQGAHVFLLDSVTGLSNMSITSLDFVGEGLVRKGRMSLAVPVNLLGHYNVSTLISNKAMHWSTMPKNFTGSAKLTLETLFTLAVSTDDFGKTSPGSTTSSFAVGSGSAGKNNESRSLFTTCKGPCNYVSGGPARCRTVDDATQGALLQREGAMLQIPDNSGALLQTPDWATCLGKVEFSVSEFTLGISDVELDLGLPEVYGHLFNQVANGFVSDMKVDLVDFAGTLLKKKLAHAILDGVTDAIGGKVSSNTTDTTKTSALTQVLPVLISHLP